MIDKRGIASCARRQLLTTQIASVRHKLQAALQLLVFGHPLRTSKAPATRAPVQQLKVFRLCRAPDNQEPLGKRKRRCGFQTPKVWQLQHLVYVSCVCAQCREDPHLAEKLQKNPEEGKVRVVSTAEGDMSTAADWFKGGRAGPSLVFASASTQGKSASLHQPSECRENFMQHMLIQNILFI